MVRQTSVYREFTLHTSSVGIGTVNAAKSRRNTFFLSISALASIEGKTELRKVNLGGAGRSWKRQLIATS